MRRKSGKSVSRKNGGESMRKNCGETVRLNREKFRQMKSRRLKVG